MPSEVVWLPRAKLNLDHQLDYIETRNPRAAIAIGRAVVKATAMLRRHPDIGRIGRKSATRELVIAGTPYLLVYRVEPDAIVILRFLHGAQRWPET